jgi:hypothetical protein
MYMVLGHGINNSIKRIKQSNLCLFLSQHIFCTQGKYHYSWTQPVFALLKLGTKEIFKVEGLLCTFMKFLKQAYFTFSHTLIAMICG